MLVMHVIQYSIQSTHNNIIILQFVCLDACLMSMRMLVPRTVMPHCLAISQSVLFRCTASRLLWRFQFQRKIWENDKKVKWNYGQMKKLKKKWEEKKKLNTRECLHKLSHPFIFIKDFSHQKVTQTIYYYFQLLSYFIFFVFGKWEENSNSIKEISSMSTNVLNSWRSCCWWCRRCAPVGPRALHSVPMMKFFTP